MRHQFTVLPLQFLRSRDGNVKYSRNVYFTADKTFCIRKWTDDRREAWNIHVWHWDNMCQLDEETFDSFRASGMADATFSRRKDVITALETFLAAEGALAT